MIQPWWSSCGIGMLDHIFIEREQLPHGGSETLPVEEELTALERTDVGKRAHLRARLLPRRRRFCSKHKIECLPVVASTPVIKAVAPHTWATTALFGSSPP